MPLLIISLWIATAARGVLWLASLFFSKYTVCIYEIWYNCNHCMYQLLSVIIYLRQYLKFKVVFPLKKWIYFEVQENKEDNWSKNIFGISVQTFQCLVLLPRQSFLFGDKIKSALYINYLSKTKNFFQDFSVVIKSMVAYK